MLLHVEEGSNRIRGLQVDLESLLPELAFEELRCLDELGVGEPDTSADEV